METTMTKDLAMSAVREICARPWRSANTAHAGTFGSDQGRTVSYPGSATRDDKLVAKKIVTPRDAYMKAQEKGRFEALIEKE